MHSSFSLVKKRPLDWLFCYFLYLFVTHVETSFFSAAIKLKLDPFSRSIRSLMMCESIKIRLLSLMKGCMFRPKLDAEAAGSLPLEGFVARCSGIRHLEQGSMIWVLYCADAYQLKFKIVHKWIFCLYNLSEMKVISLALFPDFSGTYKGHTHSLPLLEAIRSMDVSDNRIIKEHKCLNMWKIFYIILECDS